jgi:hypothetical protein
MFAEDDDRRLRLPFFLDKAASQKSADAKHVEIVLADVLALDELRLTSRCNAKVLRAGDRRHAFETLSLGSVIQIVGIGDRRTQPDQTVLVLHDWERTNEDSVNDTEDRCV